MSRILMLGYRPPILEPSAPVEAAHYRTWQFLEPLLDDGHHVTLCVDDARPDAPVPVLSERWRERLRLIPLDFHKRGWPARLQNIHDDLQPDAIVAVNFAPALYATKLKTTRPIWMDIYGDQLTIMQLACFRAGSDRGLATSIAFAKRILQRGDVFSVCGEPQKHMLVGELAMSGRLGRATVGYELCHVVLPGAVVTDEPNIPSMRQEQRALHGLSDDAFVVLWCGGYNTWTDVDTLFSGLEIAMARNERVHYVSAGASTYAAPETMYDRFERRIQQSPYRDRFTLLGWQPWGNIGSLYGLSDLGLNIDALHYETLYGTRTRLTEMLGSGLPVLTSLGSELSYLLRDHSAAATFEVGSSCELAHAVVNLAESPELYRNVKSAGLDYARSALSFAATTAEFSQWVNRPTTAPDRHAHLADKLSAMKHKFRSIGRGLIWDTLSLEK